MNYGLQNKYFIVLTVYCHHWCKHFVSTESVFTCSVSPDGSLAASGGEDDMAYIWNVSSGNIVLSCSGHKVNPAYYCTCYCRHCILNLVLVFVSLSTFFTSSSSGVSLTNVKMFCPVFKHHTLVHIAFSPILRLFLFRSLFYFSVLCKCLQSSLFFHRIVLHMCVSPMMVHCWHLVTLQDTFKSGK